MIAVALPAAIASRTSGQVRSSTYTEGVCALAPEARRRTAMTRSARIGDSLVMWSARRVGRSDDSLQPDPEPRALDPIIDLGAEPLEPSLEACVVPHFVVDARVDGEDDPRQGGVRPLKPRERLLGVAGPRVVRRKPPRGGDRAVNGVTGGSRRERGAERVSDLRRLPEPPQGVQAHGPHAGAGAEAQRGAVGGVARQQVAHRLVPTRLHTEAGFERQRPCRLPRSHIVAPRRQGYDREAGADTWSQRVEG